MKSDMVKGQVFSLTLGRMDKLSILVPHIFNISNLHVLSIEGLSGETSLAEM